MDSVSLVVGALAVGAVKGVGDSAAAAVQDAYRGLKALLASRFSDRTDIEAVVEPGGSDTEAWKAQLTETLSRAPVVLDEEVVAAARRVLELADPQGARDGVYRADLRGAQGVQVGDRNVQSNVFGSQARG